MICRTDLNSSKKKLTCLLTTKLNLIWTVKSTNLRTVHEVKWPRAGPRLRDETQQSSL